MPYSVVESEKKEIPEIIDTALSIEPRHASICRMNAIPDQIFVKQRYKTSLSGDLVHLSRCLPKICKLDT